MAPVIIVASILFEAIAEIPASKTEIKIVEDLTKFGTVVVAVERMLVPNNSAAVLINTAQ